jgi:hypothetical protein
MIERMLLAAPALVALAIEYAIGGGLPAAAVAIASGAVAVAVAATLRPGWAAGTVVAAGLIVETAVASERSWWRTAIAAALLATVLITGELCQTGVDRSSSITSLRVHSRALIVCVIGVAAVLGGAAVNSGGATLAAVLLGIAAAATLVALLLTHASLGDR